MCVYVCVCVWCEREHMYESVCECARVCVCVREKKKSMCVSVCDCQRCVFIS